MRRRLLTWRARLSVPSLLARCDERTVISTITAVHGGLAILIISVIAWFVDLPLLFPALGPTAFILFSSPFSPAAAPRSVVVGHFAAIAAGFVVWQIVTLVSGQAVSIEAGGWPILVSASLALGLTCVLLVSLSCPHAPACATALITALGAAHGWWELFGMAAGVLLLTGQAILISRVSGINIPTWSPRSNDTHQF